MAPHSLHLTHPALAGHVVAVRPRNVHGTLPTLPATQVKTTWRKATAVDCSPTADAALRPMLIDGTPFAAWRPPGGARG